MACIETIFSRASIRRFKPDPIPIDIIKKIVEAGTRAPNAGGFEKWFFIVVLSEDKRRRIHELLKKAHILYAEKVLAKPMRRESIEKWARAIDEGMYFAPVYIAGYIDLREHVYSEEYRDVERLWLHQSVAAAFENMILAAWSMGIASVWLGVPLLMRKEFDEVLRPPQGMELAGILALGYPMEEAKPRRRKPIEEVMKIV